MENTINFYEFDKNDLLSYSHDNTDELYTIITDANRKLYNDNWSNKCHALIKECTEIFSIINSNYVYFIDAYIIKFKKCLTNNEEIDNFNNTYKFFNRQIKLYIQLLEYLKIINYDNNVFFDTDKYNIVISAYDIFFNLKEDVNKSYIEWYSNNYIFYYSQSTNYTNICIYHLDDLFGYKIFMTYKKNNLTNKIKISVYDVIINTQVDFYNKIEKSTNSKLYFIKIEQLAKCFSINSNNITKEYQESNFIDSCKMLQYAAFFLND